MFLLSLVSILSLLVVPYVSCRCDSTMNRCFKNHLAIEFTLELGGDLKSDGNTTSEYAFEKAKKHCSLWKEYKKCAGDALDQCEDKFSFGKYGPLLTVVNKACQNDTLVKELSCALPEVKRVYYSQECHSKMDKSKGDCESTRMLIKCLAENGRDKCGPDVYPMLEEAGNAVLQYFDVCGSNDA